MEKENKPVYEIVEKENNEKYYWKYLECTNCELRGSFAIPKGEIAYQRTCPNCGCNTLIKVN